MSNLSIRYKNIIAISLPMMISAVSQNIVTVTDTAFLGRLGDIALGAAGNGGVLYFVLTYTGMGFTTGAQILIGRRNGEKAFDRIGKTFNQSLLFLIPIGILLSYLTIYIAPTQLENNYSSLEVAQTTGSFLDIRALGITFALINFLFIALYVGLTETRILIYSTLLMAGVNVFLDYALIFGNFGFPEMGVQGAALASLISEVLSFIYLLSYTLLKLDIKKYHLFRFKKIEAKLMGQILKISSPLMIQNFLSIGSWFTFFSIIEGLGERELAISHIIRSIYMALMIPVFGLSSTTNTLVSNLIGAGKLRLIKPLVWRIVLMSVGCTFVFLILNLLFPREIIGVYTNDHTLIEEALDSFYVISITMFLFAIAFILFNAISGTGKVWLSLLIEAITIAIYIPFTIWITKTYENLPLVWGSEFVYFGALGGLSLFFLRRSTTKIKEI